MSFMDKYKGPIYIGIAVVFIIGWILTIYFSIIKQHFTNLESISFDLKIPSNLQNITDKSYTPDKLDLDQVSANNVLTFTDNQNCKSKDTYEQNQDCNPNYGYQETMCLNRRIANKEQLCNSIVNFVPRPQDQYNPSNFKDF